MHRLNCCLWILGLAALTTVGCSSGKTTLDTVPVEGVVTLDGEPMAEATVRFQPVDPSQGMSATGKTDANGVYKLTAVPTGDVAAVPGAGTLPGEYVVGVTKTSFKAIEEDEDAASAGTGSPTDDGITFIIPQRYNNPQDSGLKVTVTDGENNIPLELTTSE
jgi:hypothetical protein